MQAILPTKIEMRRITMNELLIIDGLNIYQGASWYKFQRHNISTSLDLRGVGPTQISQVKSKGKLHKGLMNNRDEEGFDDSLDESYFMNHYFVTCQVLLAGKKKIHITMWKPNLNTS